MLDFYKKRGSVLRRLYLLWALGLGMAGGCATQAPEPVLVDSIPISAVPDAIASSLPSLFLRSKEPELETLYSLSVDDVPIEAVLRSVAKQAKLTLIMQVQPRVNKSLHLIDQPLHEVLNAIISGCDCRYTLSENQLRILSDAPVSQNYAIDYLNISREVVADLAIATSVGNLSATSSGGDGQGNASRTAISSQSTFDLWQSIDMGLRSVLRLKADDFGVQVNPAAGLVVVHGKHQQHQAVARYLARLQSRILRQVSIEAQVIEIELNESHAAGVDWREIAQGEGLSWLQNMSSGFSDLAKASGSVLQYSNSGGSSSTRVLVNLLEEYGDVRVISAPRIVALNNQPSVLSVVENKVYFSSSVERESSSDNSKVTESVETTIHTVPVGLVMQVTPQVARDGSVVMSIRPTISRVSSYVIDPNPILAAAGVVSRIPEVQVRELETVLRVSDGETIVLGGMMQLRNSSDHQHVPWLHSLPVVGALFSSRKKAMQQAELLILLTPTVLPMGAEL